MAIMERPQMAPEPDLEPGMVNEAEGALPNEGVTSVEDDVSATAKEGDFILPYETILFVGFEEINNMILEAAAAAEQDGVQVADIDPQDEVPIQISNYEYRVPQELIPYIGMDILNALREKGLEFRQQLEAGRGEGFMERPSPTLGAEMPPMQDEMPSMPEQAPMPMPEQAPMPPMMQGGGYVPTQGVGTTHNPGFNNPLQPPTKSMQNETLDMRGGGLVKKNPIKMVM